MTKYNPSKTEHRTWLAQNLLTLLGKWGFKQSTAETSIDTWEYVLERENRFNEKDKILIYTSIEKRSGAMRYCGTDRIRIVKKKEVNQKPCYKKVRQINRVGEFKDINSRVCEGILNAQKI